MQLLNGSGLPKNTKAILTVINKRKYVVTHHIVRDAFHFDEHESRNFEQITMEKWVSVHSPKITVYTFMLNVSTHTVDRVENARTLSH